MYLQIISNIKIFFYYLKTQTEIRKNEYILKCTNNHKIKILKKIKKSQNPIISIISPIYNSEKYILRFLKSIQNQNYIDIEILLIDDSSTDNSINLIKKYLLEDQRIILIKNKINKGTFINRNIGVLFSKGNYIILPDPDDILTNNILNLCYRYAIKYKVEMIRFNIYKGKGVFSFNSIIKNIETKKINQPELSIYLFYGNNELKIIDCVISNKFIKKEAYIRALNSLNNFYSNLYIIFMEDTLINYMLYRTAKNFLFIKYSGYYYIRSTESITNNLFKISNLILKNNFFFLKLIFEFTKNTKYEKDITNIYFNVLNQIYNFNKHFSLLPFDNNFYLYYNIVELFLNSKYFNKENKKIFKNVKDIILKKIRNKKKTI